MDAIVVGAHSLQNALIADLVCSEIGVECGTCEFSSLEKVLSKYENLLVLLECSREDADFCDWPRLVREKGRAGTSFACFNVNHDRERYLNALREGARGIFYSDDTPTTMVKGIKLMLRGELWVSRRALVDFMLEQGGVLGSPKFKGVDLTAREKEVLLLVATGSSNDEIADELCISPHTVKTHLYNVYRKIDVDNRLQAALWAAKYV